MELRKDYILDRWVIISSVRGKRPHEFKKKWETEKVDVCFFCPGNEGMTPAEIGRIAGKGKSWKFRWFPNKFPAVEKEGQAEIRTDNTFYTFSNSYGVHEIIVETPDHDKQLWDLKAEDIKEVLKIYSQRITALSKEPGIKYVAVFKNHGKEAGTSIVHSHTQIIAINHVPKAVRDEVEASKGNGGCAYCKIIESEKGSHRRCFENDMFVAFTPYASRFNYEIWVFPKKHVKSTVDMDDRMLGQLAEIMAKILAKLKDLGCSFNYYLHYAPEGEDLHFHIEFAPRIANWAGFEFNTGTIINSVPPEDAAKFYRDRKSVV